MKMKIVFDGTYNIKSFVPAGYFWLILEQGFDSISIYLGEYLPDGMTAGEFTGHLEIDVMMTKNLEGGYFISAKPKGW